MTPRCGSTEGEGLDGPGADGWRASLENPNTSRNRGLVASLPEPSLGLSGKAAVLFEPGL